MCKSILTVQSFAEIRDYKKALIKKKKIKKKIETEINEQTILFTFHRRLSK